MDAPLLIGGAERFDDSRARPVTNPARPGEVVGRFTAGRAAVEESSEPRVLAHRPEWVEATGHMKPE